MRANKAEDTLHTPPGFYVHLLAVGYAQLDTPGRGSVTCVHFNETGVCTQLSFYAHYMGGRW
eukprot:3298501-Pyramimonas_sp.AAC.2